MSVVQKQGSVRGELLERSFLTSREAYKTYSNFNKAAHDQSYKISKAQGGQ